MDDGITRDGIKPGDVVVVTGGGGGFGRAFASRFARGGAKVAVWEVNKDAGEETVRQVKAAGGEARFFPVDLSDAQQINRAVEQTLAAYCTPYVIVNNASVYPRFGVIDMPVEDWERALRINITAPFLIVRAFGPHMLKQKRGVVINICSGRAVQGAKNGAGYAASKAALLSLTKTLALEWARHGIRVNAIIPGVSMTAQPLENTTPEELLERGQREIPLGRVGYPEDMAGLAAFMASADGAYMTGQGVAMNGGRVLIP
jgi:NAD(P)-dependent dehydrogenase (short-subunit alcohol dehydrogenase family)